MHTRCGNYQLSLDQEDTMGKTATKKNSATATKKAGAKMTGEDIINLVAPPEQEAACGRTGSRLILDHNPQGVHGQPLLKWVKGKIDMLFHKSGVPSKSAKPVMNLSRPNMSTGKINCFYRYIILCQINILLVQYGKCLLM